jgi:hypothetical protein
MDTQIQHFTDKLINIGNCIHDNWVPHCLAWQGFQTMVWQSLKYPLATCCFTHQNTREDTDNTII